MINLKKNLRLVKAQKRKPFPSLLEGNRLRTAHMIWGNGRKDGFFVRCRRTYVLNKKLIIFLKPISENSKAHKKFAKNKLQSSLIA